MGDVRNAAGQEQKPQWGQVYRAKASELLKEVVVYQDDLFHSGDLTPYLRMLSKMNYQNSRNLLLLMNKCPAATCLAGFRVWQSRMPDPSATILRKGQKGKGIDLLVPFTDAHSNGITWYAPTHFDISLVRVPYSPPKSPYQPSSPNHIPALLSALYSVLGNQYQTTVNVADDPEDLEQLQITNSDGSIRYGHFLVRPDLSDQQKLRWLAVSTCRLSLKKNGIPQAYENYFSLCAAHCLFQIWGIPKLSQLAPNPSLLKSADAGERGLLLDLLQRCVYTLDSQIAGPYVEIRALDDETTGFMDS